MTYPNTFTTAADAKDEIEKALGEFVDDFDVDLIFDLCYEYDEGIQEFYCAVEPEEFWKIAEICDIHHEKDILHDAACFVAADEETKEIFAEYVYAENPQLDEDEIIHLISAKLISGREARRYFWTKKDAEVRGIFLKAASLGLVSDTELANAKRDYIERTGRDFDAQYILGRAGLWVWNYSAMKLFKKLFDNSLTTF